MKELSIWGKEKRTFQKHSKEILDELPESNYRIFDEMYFLKNSGKIYKKREDGRYYEVVQYPYNTGKRIQSCVHIHGQTIGTQILVARAWGIWKEGCEIHHVDENPLNNRPQNLIALTPSQHKAVHLGYGVWIIDPEKNTKKGFLSLEDARKYTNLQSKTSILRYIGSGNLYKKRYQITTMTKEEHAQFLSEFFGTISIFENN